MSNLRPIDTKLPRPAAVDAGPAPMLQWIDVDRLVVDERYQRGLKEANWKAVKRIAASFDWSKFSTVHVSPIEGGLFAIIDGQHRTHAAAACGFASVPCQVTHMTLEQQAASFAAINGVVTAVTPWQILKAAVAAREAWALQIVDVCERAGCKAMVANRPTQDRAAGEIYSVTYLRAMIDKRTPDRIVQALTIMRQTEGVGEVPEFYAYGFFRPIIEALSSRPHVLARPEEARAFLAQCDLEDLSEKASRFLIERRRKGLPTLAKSELLESLIGDAIDEAMPQRMAMPRAGT